MHTHMVLQEGLIYAHTHSPAGKLDLCTHTHTHTVLQEVRGGLLECAHQFVGRPFQRNMVIHNLGRKAQHLTWISEKLDEVRKEYAKAMRAKCLCVCICGVCVCVCVDLREAIQSAQGVRKAMRATGVCVCVCVFVCVCVLFSRTQDSQETL